MDKLTPDELNPSIFQLLTSTSYEYDEVGNRISQIDAEGRETKYEYDSLRRRTKRLLPEGQEETYVYTLTGALASRSDFNGYTTSYIYDELDRVLEVQADPTHPSLVYDHAPAKIVYDYNVAGQQVLAVTYNASDEIIHAITMDFDEQGRLIEKGATGGSLNYSYDLAGNLKTSKSTTEGGLDLAFTYDALNRLKTVGDQAFTPPETHTYDYTAVGSLESVSYANGVKHSYQYDNLNHLIDLNVTDIASQVLKGYVYDLNAVGHRTNVTEANGRITDYTYDDLYRLTQESVNAPVGQTSGVADYTYDKVGNRQTRSSTFGTLPNQTFGYDLNDRLNNHDYDNNGNTVESEGDVDIYDFQNHLIRRDRVNGSALEYTYDAHGTLVRKEVINTSNIVQSSELYLVDENNHTGYSQVVEEFNLNSVLIKTYTYGHDLIAQDEQVEVDVWALRYYLYDGHGNVRGLSDEVGLVTDSYEYDAFGNLLDRVGGTSNSYLYTGERFDPDLGLYYLRARYNNPNTGRFHSMDTFEGNNVDPVSLHKYLYASGNPVMMVDPSGNIPVSITSLTYAMGIGATIGATATVFANHALGRAQSVSSIAKGALFGALLGPLAVVSPIAGLGIAAYGVVASSSIVLTVFMNENSSLSQKVAASALLVASIYGGAKGIQYARANGYGVTLKPQVVRNHILGDRTEASFARFMEQNGVDVIPRVSTQSLFHSRNRVNDFIIRNPKTKDLWAIELKGSRGAFIRNDVGARAQFAADRSTNIHGSRAVGGNARAAGIEGQPVVGTIKILWE